jgi:hypothetical protein
MAPPKQIAAIAISFEFPAVLVEASIALQGRGKVEVLIPARLDDASTEIVGVKQDHHLDAGGGLDLPEELGGQCRALLEGES